ncbi:MAG: preprotein translocase subunit SecE [Candidatus Marinimicrobia bacterium]|nr:preprotein translocase subunit SecE [Candidatus Neomarinimicrobiota bacterium]
MFKKIKKFLEDVVFEMKKVSWPSWEELKSSTTVVISLSILLTIFLFFADAIFSKIINLIL